MPTWTVKPEPVTGAGIDEAIWQYFTEIGQRVLGRPATETELRHALGDDPHSNLNPPHGVFLVARDSDGTLLGYAGVRLLANVPATAELKPMYVRPAGRGAGLGRGLLPAAESSARELAP
ncbi:GNAT family N-acetyltransferase [Streptomyces sp. NPDC005355]|uniref:GNAT family N-acetyltransferase n=1 Tax=Streptomyces sp. NPDC005355 TaxID=3157038 RepID=UPI00339E79E4